MENLNEVVEDSSTVTKYYIDSLIKEPRPADYEYIFKCFREMLVKKGFTEEEIQQILNELEDDSIKAVLSEKVKLPKKEIRYIRQLQRAAVDEVFNERIFQNIIFLVQLRFPDRGKQIEAAIYLKADAKKRQEFKDHPETQLNKDDYEWLDKQADISSELFVQAFTNSLSQAEG